jgi:zinc transport system substrate-binding protein
VTKLAEAVHAKATEAGLGGDKAALDAFRAKVAKVDESYLAMVAQAERRSMVVAHDAWGHLTRRYGLTFVAITGLQAGEATPAAIESAVKASRELGATAVAVEPQISQRVARRVAKAANLRVLTMDPLGSGDWFELMERNLATLREALGVRATPPAPATPVSKAPSPA